MGGFKVLTFGCQMNEHDSEKMAGLLGAEGYEAAGSVESADLVLLNTCSIREKAEQKFYSELGRLRLLKKHNPSLIIAVSGCIAQQEGEKIFKRAPFVDFVFGNQNINELPRLIEAARAGVRESLTDFADGYEDWVVPAERSSSITAFVNIMYGCDNFCSYCIVPYVRGRERSRKASDVVSEIRALAAAGAKEVTLLGQNVNSYGRKAKGDPHYPPFHELLRLVGEVDGIERIRFVTSHPKDLSDGLIRAIADLPKVCEGIHLPLQSASDRILKAMNRGYTFAAYMEKVNKLRDAVPDIMVTTDLIVGFPSETEEEYMMTMDAVRDVGYDSAFSFLYSERPGTAALKLPDQLPYDIKLSRLNGLIDLVSERIEARNLLRVGLVEEVLVEGPDRSGEPGRLSGRSRGGRKVNFAGPEGLLGRLVNVRITEAKKHSLVGEMVDK